MKILVLGSQGMAGHVISIYLKENGHEVEGIARTDSNMIKMYNCDITNFNQLEAIIERGKYDVIINAIGILNENASKHKPLAIIVNSYLPHYLSELSLKIKTKIIHLSTDCVFSGRSGGYIETSHKDGETFYDRTKALGEIEQSNDLTFRMSIIGPDMKKDGIGLFNWFMLQKYEVFGYSKVIWTGITTITLAKAINAAITEDLKGIYHLVNNVPIDKYKLLKLINFYFRTNSIKINKDDFHIMDKSLINTRKDFNFIVPNYEDMILEMKQWMDNHKELYPHYYN